MKYDSITEESIKAMVDAFYAKVRDDAVLGPIFNAAIADWEPHLRTMYAFWSSVMTGTGRYKGTPMAVHLRLPGLTEEHFTPWLQLFEETVEELFDDITAQRFAITANRIADSLKLGLQFRPPAMTQEG